MKRLNADILSYSRLNSGEPKFENFDLNEIIGQVKEELREAIKEKKAIIEIKELCSAYIIPIQFRQLMLNLLTNSLQFSKPGIPPHIIIQSVNIITSKANPHDLIPGREYCHISIKDNSIGFAPEFKAKIHELFQRSHEKDDYEGMDVSLSIVKQIVDNHNGRIIATSEPNEGAMFDIYLPVEFAELASS